MSQRKKQPVQTRQAILKAAGEGFASGGYSGTGLGAIVEKAGLTKGALFHHFKDKSSMALAWIQADLSSAMEESWFAPLENVASLDALKNFCRTGCLAIREDDAASALTALTAETAALDATLREALEGVFSRWRGAFAAMLEAGKAAGWIHRSIQPETEAAFIVSFLAGLTVTAKAAASEGTLRTGATALTGYLETLRAQ